MNLSAVLADSFANHVYSPGGFALMMLSHDGWQTCTPLLGSFSRTPPKTPSEMQVYIQNFRIQIVIDQHFVGNPSVTSLWKRNIPRRCACSDAFEDRIVAS